MTSEPSESHTDPQPADPQPADPQPAEQLDEDELAEGELAEGEEIAVPAGDLTGALTEAFEHLTDPDEDRQDSER
jgi:hypothetical protein